MSPEDLFVPETEDTVHAQCTLGTRPPPNGMWSPKQRPTHLSGGDKHKHLLNMSTTIAKRILGCSLTRGECMVGCKTMCLPKIECSSAATCFSIKEAEQIQNPVLQAFLTKTGLNRNMKCAIVFGPSRCRGAEFHHQCVEQGINKTMQFVGQVCSGSQTGETMLINMETVQLMSGTSTPVFEEQ